MKRFNFRKFRLVQIFLGLIHGVKVSKYAKIGLNAEQMREIREGLEAGINVSYYSEPREKGKKGYYSSEAMKILKNALISGVDTRIIELWKNEYVSYKKPFELSDIALCTEAGMDVGSLLDKGYDGKQIDLICRILHLHPEMEEKLFEYINPDMRCHVIKFIFWGLELKSDVSEYHKLGREMTFEQAKKLIWWHKKGFDITKYIECYSFEQIENIYYGKTQLVDVSKYEDKNFTPQQMYEIRTGLEMGIDVSSYADKRYSSMQMKVIRKGLIAGVDVSKYANPKMTPPFMREVLEALLVLKRAEAYEK